MDYEKAFKESYERASLRFGTNVANELFLEYKESKEERTRRKLIEFFSDWSKTKSHCWGIRVTDIITWLEKQCKCEIDCHSNHQDVNHPNGCITLEDFNGGEGFYKVHLDYLNEKQVEKIEEMIRTWNKDSKVPNENIKSCIEMCLTDACEQRFRDYNTSLKDCLAWLEKQGTSYTKRDVDDAYVEGMAFAKHELEKQKPAWNEDDERAFYHVLSVLEEYGEEHPSKSKFVCNWLKSIKARMGGGQSMTRKEERELASIKYAEEHPSDYTNEMYDIVDIEKAFKTGAEWADATAWKPSEKQIEALEDEVRNNKTVFRKKVLNELLEQLKKL